MSPLAIAVVAMSMSMDSLVASISRGAGLHRPRLVDALRTGLVFGCVEMTAPLLGWLAGIAASHYIAAVDHWIALILLTIVGSRMIVNALRREVDEAAVAEGRSFLILVVTAVGTSIDSMIVGVSLAFLQVNIVVVALAIGLSTFTFSTIGVMVGRLISVRFGRWAEVLGGLGLIGLGVAILFDHLTV
ncbi:MAG: hypothetical protein C0606_07045 [Hyphomicrobiales bacterium]|nr:MAG: hypothetical protein C0606_07045 [Hyphomicrobiales bacterium]